MNGVGSRKVDHFPQCCVQDVTLNQTLIQWLPRGTGAWSCVKHVDGSPFLFLLTYQYGLQPLARRIYPHVLGRL